MKMKTVQEILKCWDGLLNTGVNVYRRSKSLQPAAYMILANGSAMMAGIDLSDKDMAVNQLRAATRHFCAVAIFIACESYYEISDEKPDIENYTPLKDKPGAKSCAFFYGEIRRPNGVEHYMCMVPEEELDTDRTWELKKTQGVPTGRFSDILFPVGMSIRL